MGNKYKLKHPVVPLVFNPRFSLSFIERNYCLAVFQHNKFNIADTAKVLEIDRSTLYRKLAMWEAEGYLCQRP